MAKSKTYLTRDLQSVYDLAVQLYGDVSKIGILLELFPNLNEGIDLSSSIMVDPQTDPIAKFFSDKRIIVSTDYFTDLSIITFDRIEFKWDSNIQTFDMG